MSNSVTRWINDLRDGDRSAANRLWGFLERQVCRTAKSQVARSPHHPVYDEEDVALSAFTSLCDGFESGRYDDITDRQQLWRLLAVITVNKARKRAIHENRIRRGGQASRVADGSEMLGTVPSTDFGPENQAIMEEECRRLLSLLGERELKLLALLKVEGYTNQEIAEQLGCSRRTIQRRLDVIRDIWTEELS